MSPIPGHQHNWKAGLALALITTVSWALLPLGLKGILEVMDIWTITWYRFVASALIGIVWYGRHSVHPITTMLGKPHRLFTVITIFGLLGNYAAYLIGLDLTTASSAAIVIQIAPLCLLASSVFLFKEAFSTLQWAGVGAFTTGLLLFFNLRLGGFVDTSPDYFNGVLFVVLAAVLWTCYGLGQKKLLASFLPRDIMLLIYIAGSVVFLPLATPTAIFILSGTQVLLLAFVSLNTIVAYGCFAQAMAVWEASRVSAVITLGPLLTLLFAQLLWLFLPNYMALEPLNLLSWAGAVLVAAGSAFAALAGSAKSAQ